MYYEKLFGFRYILSGKCNGKYGIKDLNDNVTELYTEDETLELGKLFKIAGVTGDCIDLHWFKVFFAKLSMTVGKDKAEELVGLRIDGSGNFHMDRGLFEYRFIEFASDFLTVTGFPLVLGEPPFIEVLKGVGFLYALNDEYIIRINIGFNVSSFLSSDLLFRHCNSIVREVRILTSVSSFTVKSNFCIHANVPTHVVFGHARNLELSQPLCNKNIVIEGSRITGNVLDIADSSILDTLDLYLYTLPKFVVKSVKDFVNIILKLELKKSFWSCNELWYRVKGIDTDFRVLNLYSMSDGDITISGEGFWILDYTDKYKIFVSKVGKIDSNNFEDNHGITYDQFLNVCAYI